MEKKIFLLEISIDTKEKSVQAHVGCNDEDFDPEAISMLKEICADMTKMVATAYTKKVLTFTNSKESEVKA